MRAGTDPGIFLSEVYQLRDELSDLGEESVHFALDYDRSQALSGHYFTQITEFVT